MSKGNPKTMRFDEEVENIINNNYDGKNFSERFHNLVYDFQNKLPFLEKQKRDLQKNIDDKKNELRDLERSIYKYQRLVNNLDSVRRDIENVIQK